MSPNPKHTTQSTDHGFENTRIGTCNDAVVAAAAAAVEADAGSVIHLSQRDGISEDEKRARWTENASGRV